jgi:hypothetical protein
LLLPDAQDSREAPARCRTILRSTVAHARRRRRSWSVDAHCEATPAHLASAPPVKAVVRALWLGAAPQDDGRGRGLWSSWAFRAPPRAAIAGRVIATRPWWCSWARASPRAGASIPGGVPGPHPEKTHAAESGYRVVTWGRRRHFRDALGRLRLPGAADVLAVETGANDALRGQDPPPLAEHPGQQRAWRRFAALPPCWGDRGAA